MDWPNIQGIHQWMDGCMDVTVNRADGGLNEFITCDSSSCSCSCSCSWQWKKKGSKAGPCSVKVEIQVLATPSFGEVEEHLHLGSVAVVGHPTDGHEGVAYRQQGEVGAREMHLGSRGGDTEELKLKRLKNMLRFLCGCLASYNEPIKKTK